MYTICPNLTLSVTLLCISNTTGADDTQSQLFTMMTAVAKITESSADSGYGVRRECIAAVAPAPALQNSSTGVLKNHDDIDEDVMIAALDQYESKTGPGVMLC